MFHISSLNNYSQIISTFFVGTHLHFLFYITLSFMAGIVWAYNGYHIVTALEVTALLALAWGLTRTKKDDYKLPIFIFLSFFAGGLAYRHTVHQQELFFESTLQQKIGVQATVQNIESIDNPRFNYRVSISLHAVKNVNDFKPCSANSILLYVKEINQLQTGDLIEISNIIFKKAANQDFNTYLLKEGYVASLFLEKFEYTLVNRPTWSVNKIISDLKEKTLNDIAYTMNADAFKLFSSLFLGNRTIVKKEMENTKEYFKVWGVSHYLARSGLHLVIFVLIWQFILGLIPISYFFKQCVIIFLILVYALLSWSSVSFERALVMFLLYKFCLAHKMPIYYIHLITLATLIILLLNPLELFFLDFQLSFGITFALAWFNSVSAEKRRLIM